MMERYAKHLNFRVPIRASYLDKHYSKLLFVSKTGFLELEDADTLDKELILNKINYEWRIFQDKINAAPLQKESSQTATRRPPTKKTKFLSIDCEGGDTVEAS